MRKRRERYNDQKGALDVLETAQRMEQHARLRRLTQAHLIAQDDIAPQVPIQAHPINAFQLIRAQHAPRRHRRRRVQPLPPAHFDRRLVLALLAVALLLLLALLTVAPAATATLIHVLLAFLSPTLLGSCFVGRCLVGRCLAGRCLVGRRLLGGRRRCQLGLVLLLLFHVAKRVARLARLDGHPILHRGTFPPSGRYIARRIHPTPSPIRPKGAQRLPTLESRRRSMGARLCRGRVACCADNCSHYHRRRCAPCPFRLRPLALCGVADDIADADDGGDGSGGAARPSGGGGAHDGTHDWLCRCISSAIEDHGEIIAEIEITVEIAP